MPGSLPSSRAEPAPQGLGAGGLAAVAVREDPGSFARAVTTLLADETERRRLENAAGEFARTLPTWDVAAEALAQCYEELAASDENSDSVPRTFR
ncbi:MAG: hypothetical protein M3N24_02295 [Actinomycetota bacterium]|nr:hypothetical protein [Actinomycetota bacterium]